MAERFAEGGQEGDAALRNERAEHAARQAAQSWVAVDDVEYVPFNDGVVVLNVWRARILL